MLAPGQDVGVVVAHAAFRRRGVRSTKSAGSTGRPIAANARVITCFWVIPSLSARSANASANSSVTLILTSTLRPDTTAGGNERPASVATWRKASAVAGGAFATLLNSLAAIWFTPLYLDELTT